MKKQAKIKSAVITSIIAMLLSVAMLFGTTFAWFTDSVTNTNNIIKSGNVDVELWHTNKANVTEEVNGKTSFFTDLNGESMLWEPNASTGEIFTIKNVGSLALKYELRIAPIVKTSTEAGKSLTDVINLTVKGDKELYNDFFKDGCVIKGTLLAGEKADYTVDLAWNQTDNDNDYNVKGGLCVVLGVDLVATQFSFEKDGYNGDSYDNGAQLPEIVDTWDGTSDISWYLDNKDADFYVLSSAEALAGLAELVDGTATISTYDGQTITLDKVTFEDKEIILTSDIDLYEEDENGEPISFEPIGSFSDNCAFEGTFDGQGHTVSNLYQNGWALQNGYWDGPEYGMGFFSLVENAAIKNVNFDGASLPTEANIMGVVAGGAANCVFENINIINAYLGNHSWYSGGAIGWAEGDIKLINCDVDASSVISSQWGDFNNANGGLIGGIDPDGTYHFENCDVACVIDAYNDVTSAYEWYSYRNCGMLIGDTGEKDENNKAIATNVTCKNVIVTYGEWANYHYCQFGSASYPWCRVEAGESTGAYGNAREGEYFDANGNKVVDDNHVHNDGEKHNELIVFDQLFGGETGDRYVTYGNPAHDGVTVIYNNK